MNKKDTEGSDHIRQIIGENLGISGTKIVLDKKATTWRRLFWLTLVLSMFGVMTWQIIRRLEAFLSNPVAANIEIQYEKYVRYPVILICNQNSITRSGFYKEMMRQNVTKVFQFGRDYSDTIVNITYMSSTKERHEALRKFMEKGIKV